jgi:hypothetical protein
MKKCIKCNKPFKSWAWVGYLFLTFSVVMIWLRVFNILTNFSINFISYINPSFCVVIIGLWICETPSNYICSDCILKKCPLCNKDLKGFKCDNCKIIVCPNCDFHYEEKQKTRSWTFSTISVFSFFAIVIAYIYLLKHISLEYGDLLLELTGYLILLIVFLYIPKCPNCKKGNFIIF